MQFIMITANTEIASFIDECGVERVMIDRESKGKEKRQEGFKFPLNKHSFQDAKRIKQAVKQAKVMIRINPLHEKTSEEVAQSIDVGVDYIMLPYFHHQDEVKKFLDIVDNRVGVSLLLETASAAARAEQIMKLPGIDEIHFGLNDLHISLGHDFIFESLSGGLIEFLCLCAKKNDLVYGIGGVGRVGRGRLLAESIIMEHIRLGSSQVILSRAFHEDASTVEELRSRLDFKKELNKIRALAKEAALRKDVQVEKDRIDFCRRVEAISKEMRKKSS